MEAVNIMEDDLMPELETLEVGMELVAPALFETPSEESTTQAQINNNCSPQMHMALAEDDLSGDLGIPHSENIKSVYNEPGVEYSEARSLTTCQDEGPMHNQDSTEDEDDREPLGYELAQGFRILREVMADSNKSVNWPFIKCVDPEKDGVPDYYDRVEKPMWLQKMKEKFDGRQYETITEFVADFRLMLENCYRYNGPDHPISKRGQRLETILEQKLTLLSRDLREKTSIAATSGKTIIEKQITGTRRRKVLVPHDSTALLNQLRLEEKEREKEARKQQMMERQKEREQFISELQGWEEELMDHKVDQFKAMWELPQIGHFLFLCTSTLNIGEVMQFELERGFYMPRESNTFQNVMTTLLSTPYQRTRLENKPMMPYKVWNEKLTLKLRQWYKVYRDSKRDLQKTCKKFGLDEQFFRIVGNKNPLEKKKFHELSAYQRVWIVKGLCDYCLETQESIREAMEAQPLNELREYELGTDAEGNRYMHFPQFCGADVRIYRQSRIQHPKLEKRTMSPQKRELPSPVKSNNKPTRNRPGRPSKLSRPPSPSPSRVRQSRLRQNPKQSAQCQPADMTSSDEASMNDSPVQSDEEESDGPPVKLPRSSSRRGRTSNTSTPSEVESTGGTWTLRRSLRKVLEESRNNYTPASTPGHSRDGTPTRNSRRSQRALPTELCISRSSTPSTSSKESFSTNTMTRESRDSSPARSGSESGTPQHTINRSGWARRGRKKAGKKHTVDGDSGEEEADENMDSEEDSLLSAPFSSYMSSIVTEDSVKVCESKEFNEEEDNCSTPECTVKNDVSSSGVSEPVVDLAAKETNVSQEDNDSLQNAKKSEDFADKTKLCDKPASMQIEACEVKEFSDETELSQNKASVKVEASDVEANVKLKEEPASDLSTKLSCDDTKFNEMNGMEVCEVPDMNTSTAPSVSVARVSPVCVNGLLDDSSLCRDLSIKRDFPENKPIDLVDSKIDIKKDLSTVDSHQVQCDVPCKDVESKTDLKLETLEDNKFGLKEELSNGSVMAQEDISEDKKCLISDLDSCQSDILVKDKSEPLEVNGQSTVGNVTEKGGSVDNCSVNTIKEESTDSSQKETTAENKDGVKSNWAATDTPQPEGNVLPTPKSVIDESSDDDWEEQFPVVGEFELIGDSVDSLKELINKFAEPEPVVIGSGKKQKVVKPMPRKKCVSQLHENLLYLFKELEPWELKLTQANRRACIKMRKEHESYFEEPDEKEVEDVWESEESVSESSSDNESDDEKNEKEHKEVGENEGQEGTLRSGKSRKIEAEPELVSKTSPEVSSRGRVRKRKTIPDGAEDDTAKKKREVKELSPSPNILQKSRAGMVTSPPGVVMTSLGQLRLQQPGVSLLGNQTLLIQAPGQQKKQATNLAMKNSTLFAQLTGQSPLSSAPHAQQINLKPGQNVNEVIKALLASGKQVAITANPQHLQLIAAQQQQTNKQPTNNTKSASQPKIMAQLPGQVVSQTMSTSNLGNAIVLSTSNSPNTGSLSNQIIVSPTSVLSSPVKSPLKNLNSPVAGNALGIQYFTYNNLGQLPPNVLQELLRKQNTRMTGVSKVAISSALSTSVNQTIVSNVPQNTPIVSIGEVIPQAAGTVSAAKTSQSAAMTTNSTVPISNTNLFKASSIATILPNNIPITTAPVIGLLGSPHKPKYAGNVTVKALLENRAAGGRPEDGKQKPVIVGPVMLSSPQTVTGTSTPEVIQASQPSAVQPTTPSKIGQISLAKSSVVTGPRLLLQGANPICQIPASLVAGGTTGIRLSAVNSTQSGSGTTPRVITGQQQIRALITGGGIKGTQIATITAQQLQAAIAKKQAIDNAVKAVFTTGVSTSLPTAQIKVSSPFAMPSRNSQRPVTITTSAMKSPILSVPPFPSNENKTNLETKYVGVAKGSRSSITVMPTASVTSLSQVESTSKPATSKMGVSVNSVTNFGIVSIAVSTQVAAASTSDSTPQQAVKVTTQNVRTSQGVVPGLILPPGVVIPQQVLQQIAEKQQGVVFIQQNKDGTMQLLQLGNTKLGVKKGDIRANQDLSKHTAGVVSGTTVPSHIPGHLELPRVPTPTILKPAVPSESANLQQQKILQQQAAAAKGIVSHQVSASTKQAVINQTGISVEAPTLSVKQLVSPTSLTVLSGQEVGISGQNATQILSPVGNQMIASQLLIAATNIQQQQQQQQLKQQIQQQLQQKQQQLQQQQQQLTQQNQQLQLQQLQKQQQKAKQPQVQQQILQAQGKLQETYGTETLPSKPAVDPLEVSSCSLPNNVSEAAGDSGQTASYSNPVKSTAPTAIKLGTVSVVPTLVTQPSTMCVSAGSMKPPMVLPASTVSSQHVGQTLVLQTNAPGSPVKTAHLTAAQFQQLQQQLLQRQLKQHQVPNSQQQPLIQLAMQPAKQLALVGNVQQQNPLQMTLASVATTNTLGPSLKITPQGKSGTDMVTLNTNTLQNLVPRNHGSQPSRLVLLNVNGQLVTTEGLPVNLGQGVVKVGGTSGLLTNQIVKQGVNFQAAMPQAKVQAQLNQKGQLVLTGGQVVQRQIQTAQNSQTLHSGQMIIQPGQAVQPTQIINPVQPPQVINTVQPTQVINTVQPTQVINTVQPPQVINTVQPTQVISNVQPTQVINSLQPPHTISTVQPTQVINTVQPTQVINPVQPTQVINTVQPTQVISNVQPTQVINAGHLLHSQNIINRPPTLLQPGHVIHSGQVILQPGQVAAQAGGQQVLAKQVLGMASGSLGIHLMANQLTSSDMQNKQVLTASDAKVAGSPITDVGTNNSTSSS